MKSVRFSLIVASVVLLFASDAAADFITYQSAGGGVSAFGSHPNLGSASDSGSSQASVFDSAGSDSYSASAQLAISLGASLFMVDADASTSVEGCDPFSNPECTGQATARATIVFDLNVPALVQVRGAGRGNNRPLSILTHSTLGFVLSLVPEGEEISDCGVLDADTCLALSGVFFDSGAVLPDGEYELIFDLFAFVPAGSCAVGCLNAGGDFQFNVIPEPASGGLLGLGLGALALIRARRTGSAAGHAFPAPSPRE